MNVNELLDTIEDLLEESTGMPLSGGKRIVDVEQIRDYLDDIRANLPVELRQAQSIVSDRAQLIESANAQAQAIVKKAEERARILVSEAEIVRAARRAVQINACRVDVQSVEALVQKHGDMLKRGRVELRHLFFLCHRAQPPFVSCSEPSDTPDISPGVCPV